MRLTVFGGTGATGLLVIEEALAEGNEVVAFARNPSKLGPLVDRVTLVEGALDDAVAISQAVRGSDAVLSVLGPGRDAAECRQLVVGTEHLLQAMQDQGVRRLVAVATPSAPDRSDGRELGLRLLVLGIKLGVRAAYDAIREMDRLIRSSDLEWTIVRVPLLADGSGELGARPRRIGERGPLRLDRRALARFLVAQVEDPAWIGRAPFVSNP